MLSPKMASGQQYPKIALPGDYCDPTILRDGKDYYMTHSAFFNAPGLLIWHSTDLQHWEPVCRALTEIPGLVYAPDLIKHDGKFYIYFPASGSNYVIWSKNIQGPWSKPIDLKVPRIDPGHAVGEDGKRYLFLSGGGRVKLTDDGLATDGPLEQVYEGWDFPKEWKTEGKWLESPKFFKRGGYIYFVSAEGGTAGPPTSHMIIAARSKSIHGPWENSPYNPIVHTYSADEHWWSKGHGTVIDDINGNWWVVYHAYPNSFHTLGRFTLVEPVEWTNNGWFRVAKKPIKALGSTLKTTGFNLSDNFSKEALSLQWTLWKEPILKGIHITGRGLLLEGKGNSPRDGRVLICSPQDTSYVAEVSLVLPQNGIGGLMLFYNEKVFTGITVAKNEIIWYQHDSTAVKKKRDSKGPVYLRIINHQNKCSFLISDDKINWETVARDIEVSQLNHNIHRGFLNLKIGLLASGEGMIQYNKFTYKALGPSF